jgi:hypothetical protein
VVRVRVGAHAREVHPQVALGLLLQITGHRTPALSIAD